LPKRADGTEHFILPGGGVESAGGVYRRSTNTGRGTSPGCIRTMFRESVSRLRGRKRRHSCDKPIHPQKETQKKSTFKMTLKSLAAKDHSMLKAAKEQENIQP